jgi:hypothetical protein
MSYAIAGVMTLRRYGRSGAFERGSKLSAVPLGRGVFRSLPSAETLGYWRVSLRDFALRYLPNLEKRSIPALSFGTILPTI